MFTLCDHETNKVNDRMSMKKFTTSYDHTRVTNVVRPVLFDIDRLPEVKVADYKHAGSEAKVQRSLRIFGSE
jgi:hypothetical protein